MFNDLSELRAELKSQVTELGLTEDFDASEDERKMKEADHEGKVVDGIEAVRGELKGISSSVLALLEKKIPAPEVNVDLKSVVSAIKKLETAIPSYKPQEIADYSKVLSDILAASKRKEIDLTPIIESLDALAKKESPVFTIPKELVTKDNRIRVEVDRAGSTGHRSTLSSTESAKLLTLATEAKQDDIIAALGGGVKIKKIDEALPYTYIGEAAVGTATSAAAWSIKRVDDTNDPDSTILYAGTGAYDQIWDNRVGLTYN